MNKKLLKAALISLSLSSACADADELMPQFDKLPRQDEVMNEIWHNILGMTNDPPAIMWITGADLNCGNQTEAGEYTGWWQDYDADHGGRRCISGATMGPYWFKAAWHSESTMHGTTLIHESVHAFLRQRTGDGDFWHTHRYYAQDHIHVDIYPYGQVDQWLKAKGF